MAKSPKIIVQKATAFQLTPGKGYIVHIPGAEQDEVNRLQEWFKEHGIEDAIIIMTDEFSINELPEGGK